MRYRTPCLGEYVQYPTSRLLPDRHIIHISSGGSTSGIAAGDSASRGRIHPRPAAGERPAAQEEFLCQVLMHPRQAQLSHA